MGSKRGIMYHVNLQLILTAKYKNICELPDGNKIFPYFLVAIADLTHPLSNNRSSIRIIGCFFPQKPPGSRFRFSRTGVQPSPGSLTIELPSAFAESGAFPPDRELPGSPRHCSLPLACRQPTVHVVMWHQTLYFLKNLVIPLLLLFAKKERSFTKKTL